MIVVATDAAGSLPPRRPGQQPSGLFVGRKQEIAQLTTALGVASKGSGRVVLVAGSGGIGKTRLIQELAVRAEQVGTPVLWGRCLEEAGAPAYWPWRQLIRSYLRSGAGPDLAEVFGTSLADIAGIVPEVAEHFKLQNITAPATAGDSAQSRFRLFDAVASFWRRAAQRSPPSC